MGCPARPLAAPQPTTCAVLLIAGIVHRDVKPQNVIISQMHNCCKLIDLGAAADLRIGINYIPDEFLLDPRYAPPQQYIMSPQTAKCGASCCCSDPRHAKMLDREGAQGRPPLDQQGSRSLMLGALSCELNCQQTSVMPVSSSVGVACRV